MDTKEKGFIAFRTRTGEKSAVGAGAAVSQQLLLVSPSPATALGLLPSRALSSEPARGIVRAEIRKSSIVRLQFFEQLQVLLDEMATMLKGEGNLPWSHA